MAIFQIPRSLNGSGVSFLHCEDRTAQLFRFDLLEESLAETPWAVIDDPSRSVGTRSARKDLDRYRITLTTRWPNGLRSKVRFCLKKGSPQGTLEVIARHLDAIGADWLYLTDGDGTRIPGWRFARQVSALPDQ